MISIMTDIDLSLLFEQLDPSGLEEISLQAGNTLFRRGDETTGIFRVNSGEVHMIRHTDNGQKLILHRATAGQYLAEASLFSQTCHCDAIAEQASTLTRFNKQALLNLISSDNHQSLTWMRYLSREIQNLRARVEIVSTRSASDRVWLHLQHISEPDSSIPGGYVIRKLADEIALTPEAYSRALTKLQTEKKIMKRADGGLQLSTKS